MEPKDYEQNQRDYELAMAVTIAIIKGFDGRDPGLVLTDPEMLQDLWTKVNRDLLKGAVHGVQELVAKNVALTREVVEKRSKEALNLAEEIYNNPEVKQEICPPIISLAGDVAEIAKRIAPILLALEVAGTIKGDISPVLVSIVVSLIVNAGVAYYCKKVINENIC